MMKIPLNKDMFALVDDEDFDRVSKIHWHVNDNGYALSSGMPHQRMHRFILGMKAEKYTDHINGDKLDNQKINLRACTNAQNMRNIPKKKQNTSGYKGVTWQADCNRWKAQIKVNYKNIHVGVFKIKEDAARAYNEAATIYFGQFAYLNIL